MFRSHVGSSNATFVAFSPTAIAVDANENPAPARPLNTGTQDFPIDGFDARSRQRPACAIFSTDRAQAGALKHQRTKP